MTVTKTRTSHNLLLAYSLRHIAGVVSSLGVSSGATVFRLFTFLGGQMRNNDGRRDGSAPFALACKV